MGYIKNQREDWARLFNGYGLQVICKTAVYVYTLSDKESDVVTDLGFINEKDNTIIWKKSLCNRFANYENVCDIIEEICYYFSHNKLDSWEINNIIEKVIMDNNASFFKVKINQEIKKEREEKANQLAIEMDVKNEKVIREELKNMGYYIYNIDCLLRVISFKDENIKQIFDSFDEKRKIHAIEQFNGKDLTVLLTYGHYNLWSYNGIFAYTGLEGLLSEVKKIA